MRFCEICNLQFEDRRKYCMNCGGALTAGADSESSLVQTAQPTLPVALCCPSCQREVKRESSKFCVHCGASLTLPADDHPSVDTATHTLPRKLSNTKPTMFPRPALFESPLTWGVALVLVILLGGLYFSFFAKDQAPTSVAGQSSPSMPITDTAENTAPSLARQPPAEEDPQKDSRGDVQAHEMKSAEALPARAKAKPSVPSRPEHLVDRQPIERESGTWSSKGRHVMDIATAGGDIRGEVFEVKTLERLSASGSKKGEKVRFQVLSPRRFRNGFINGEVVKSKAAGKVSGKSELLFSFETLEIAGTTIPISAELIGIQNSAGVADVDDEGRMIARSSKRRDIIRTGILSGIGALVGGIAGGKKRAAEGAAVGAAVGLTVTFTTRGEDINLAPGSVFRLSVTSQSER